VEVRLGAELHVSLTSHNLGSEPFQETGALHTYLSVAEISHVEATGLEGASFLETAGGRRDTAVQDGPVRIEGEVDRIYASKETVAVRDGTRTIFVHKHGSASTVVWNPGSEKASKLGDMPADDYEAVALHRSAHAEILVGRGQLEEAERVAREGVATLDPTGDLVRRGETHLSLATVLRAAGREDEAVTEARVALELFERKGDVPDTRRAQTFLDAANA